ncbi:MAG TPA: SH3 domain-containing protein [Anaerolineales bacterium]|nr:SH3 domain-containing protein [Anaerolineales bacterium]
MRLFNRTARSGTGPLRWRRVAVSIFGLAALAACGSGGVSDLPTPTPGPATIVLQWFRTGGIAGFCDEMTITTDGLALLADCRDPSLAAAGRRPVPADLWNQLQSWAENIDAYTDVQTDGEVADAMTVTIVFNGTGFGSAEDEDKEALQGFTEQLYTNVTRLAREGCTATANAPVDQYEHPRWEAAVPGTLEAGEVLTPDRQTADGWLSLAADSGQTVGDAATGLRWLAPNAQITRGSGCEVLPLVPAITTERCYLLVRSAVPVQSGPSERSVTLTQLRPGEYTAVVGTTENGWLQVNLDESSSPLTGSGWVIAAGADLAGPCSDLPPVES